MGKLRFEISISLDGYVAGPNQSEEHPLGEGGMQLHEWIFKLAAWREPHGREGGEVNASTPLVEEALAGRRRRRSWAAACSAAGPGRGETIPGRAGGATTRPSTCRSSSSPTTRASR